MYVSSLLGPHLAQGAYGDAADDRKTDPAKEKREEKRKPRCWDEVKVNIYSGE